MKRWRCSYSRDINLLLCLSLTFFISFVYGEPASLSFSECTGGNAIAPNLKINISTVYGQVVTNDILGRHLNFTLIGNTGQQILPESNDTGLEATLFTSSSVLTFSVFSNSSFFCSSLVPPSPLPTPDSKNYFCPLPVGPLAFSAAVPLGDHSYDLLTINTRLRVVDTSVPAIELACLDIAATPLNGQEKNGTLYGPALIIFWVSVGLAIVYWLLVGVARVVAAWDRGGSGASRSIWSRVEGAGFMVASAISGEKLAGTPALLRFCTPSMRDIVFHTQFCACMGLVAVQWPLFAYPFFAQTSWSMLTYNVTLSQGANAGQKHWDPLTVQQYNPPSNFVDQLNNPSSPIFVDSNAPNTLLMLPPNATNGVESFAAAVGLRPQDLFGICLSIFLMILAGAITLSVLIWIIDHFAANFFGRGDRDERGMGQGPALRSSSNDADKSGITTSEEDGTEQGLLRTTSRPLTLTNALGRSPWHYHYRIRPNSFHGNILHGNLVRILMLFHLPVTLFSCYQFTTGLSDSSVASVVLAVLAFIVFSIGLPLLLIVRLWNTATNKLYDETRTLMMLGPLYNHYGQGSQLFACMFFACNLIYGVTIGCGQKSGTAQAIILLVTEVISSLSTSIWLPWGRGAGMGLISFCFCVARIMVAVLVVILTPTVSIGTSAEGWVTNAILFILGLIYLAFILILVVKLIEASMRIFGHIPFDRSNHTLDSGFFGVLGLLNCLGRNRRKRRTNHRSPPDTRSSTIALGSQSALRKDTTPRSSTNGPPSVLRPEHAFLPYREDTDDEGGYIMGSWQAFPAPGYGLVDDRAPSPPIEAAAVPPPPTKSGFTRLGGGKAHFDSPYAIQASSAASTPKQEFPSSERILPLPAQSSPSPTPPPPFRNVGVDTPSNRSTVTVNHQVTSGLPPGAMSPARPAGHVRTKSQTAIIEDASVYFTHLNEGGGSSSSGAAAQTGLREDPLLPPQILVEDDGGDSSDTTEPKKGHWFNFRKNRRMSASEATPMTPTSPEEPASAHSEGGGAGRSFVVVRTKRPGSSGTEVQKTEGSKPTRAKRAASSDGRLLSPSVSDPSGL